MSFLRQSFAVALRLIVVGACCLGIWYSWNLARADYLFKLDNEESIRSAIQLVPDNWQYYLRLAQLDREHSEQLLTTALELDRYSAQTNIELGLQYEADGDYGRAEKLLLNAFEVDRTYLPRASLANFYFRRDNMPAFWDWARKAAQMPAVEIGPLLNLCWRVSPDPAKITAAIANDNPIFLRQYIAFLMTKNQLPAASSLAARLIPVDDPAYDRPLMISLVNQLVSANDGAAASSLWRLLIAKNWLAGDATVPNNAHFARDPIAISFDWLLPENPGLHSWPGPSGLDAEFTGEQPESCPVAEQSLALPPGNYTFAYSYHTTDIPANSGLHWQIVDAKSDAVLADSPSLSSDAPVQSQIEFTVPPDASVLRLRLVYQRAIGTTRIAGTLMVVSTQIKAHSQ